MPVIFCLFTFPSTAQVPYGNNPVAGHYADVGDTKIYYEVYGKGKPVVLLHGGIFGYIDEFEKLIPVLAKNYQVISIAARGHGKSGLGTIPISYSLLAEDANKVIRHVTKDSVILIGFSDGADESYLISANHPETVSKVIAIGGNLGYNDFTGDDKKFIDDLSADWFKNNMPSFITERKKLMPEPERFDEFIKAMAACWKQPVYVSENSIRSIQCPVIIVAGQNDGCPIEKYASIYRMLKTGELAIVPGSDHLVLMRKPQLMESIILDFINEK